MPIKNSFESIQISPTNLVFFFFWLIIQKNLYSQMRLAGLILLHTKEFLIGSYLCIESMEVPLFLYQVKMRYLHQDFFLASFFSTGQLIEKKSIYWATSKQSGSYTIMFYFNYMYNCWVLITLLKDILHQDREQIEIHLSSGPVNFSFYLRPLKYYLPVWQPVGKSEDKHEKSMLGFIINPCFQPNG